MPHPLYRYLDAPVRWAALAIGWWLLAFAAVTCLEIILRKLFNFSLQGIDEFGGYTLAVLAAVGFSYALVQGSHTRIDIVVTRLPGPLQALLNAVAMVVLAVAAVFIATQSYGVLADSLRFQSVANSPLQTPLWIPQGLWLTALALFSLVTIAAALHALYLLIGDWRALNRYYGPSANSEVGEP